MEAAPDIQAPTTEKPRRGPWLREEDTGLDDSLFRNGCRHRLNFAGRWGRLRSAVVQDNGFGTNGLGHGRRGAIGLGASQIPRRPIGRVVTEAIGQNANRLGRFGRMKRLGARLVFFQV